MCPSLTARSRRSTLLGSGCTRTRRRLLTYSEGSPRLLRPGTPAAATTLPALQSCDSAAHRPGRSPAGASRASSTAWIRAAAGGASGASARPPAASAAPPAAPSSRSSRSRNTSRRPCSRRARTRHGPAAAAAAAPFPGGGGGPGSRSPAAHASARARSSCRPAIGRREPPCGGPPAGAAEGLRGRGAGGGVAGGKGGRGWRSREKATRGGSSRTGRTGRTVRREPIPPASPPPPPPPSGAPARGRRCGRLTALAPRRPQ